MKKENVLRLNKDFKRLYYRGKSFVHGLIVIYCLRNRLGITRIGITASKKTGKAVRRNRARRVIKEAYLSLASEINPGWDIVFVARGKTADKKMTDIRIVMERQFQSVGILHK